MKLKAVQVPHTKKSLASKRETIFLFYSDIPQSTENTLFQHNLIYSVFLIVFILSNVHCCPYFLVKEGKMEGGEMQMYKGSKFNCKIQLLKNT